VIREKLEAFILRVLNERPYLRLYPSTVQSQGADYSVDVLPDDETVRGLGLSSVRIKHGIPGVRVRVVKGARCLLGFEAADPSKPYVSLWDAGSVEAIEFNGSTRPVARVGDLVQVNWPVLSAVGTLNGSPFAASLAVATTSTGTIQTGSDKVLAGD